MHLNGQRVSDDYFTPGWTDYNKRVYYRTYDVTKHRPPRAITPWAPCWRTAGSAATSASIATATCTANALACAPNCISNMPMARWRTSATGPGWKADTGPVLEADFLKGRNLRRPPGMARLGRGRLRRHPLAQRRRRQRRSAPAGAGASRPARARHPGIQRPGHHASRSPACSCSTSARTSPGVPRLKVSGKPGQKITLRFAERLNPDGTIYTANLRSARATDTYICKGKGTETWQPRFTFHGFQYIEVTGLSGKPGQGYRRGRRAEQRHPRRRRVHLFRPDAEPASQQHLLDPARQLH